MYQKILSGELRFPNYISEDAKSLLEGVCCLLNSFPLPTSCAPIPPPSHLPPITLLPPFVSIYPLPQLLTRDPALRLGTKGGDEVKGHPWFADVEWEKLIRKEIDPPFKPKVRDSFLLPVFLC